VFKHPSKLYKSEFTERCPPRLATERWTWDDVLTLDHPSFHNAEIDEEMLAAAVSRGRGCGMYDWLALRVLLTRGMITRWDASMRVKNFLVGPLRRQLVGFAEEHFGSRSSVSMLHRHVLPVVGRNHAVPVKGVVSFNAFVIVEVLLEVWRNEYHPGSIDWDHPVLANSRSIGHEKSVVQ
jgi:hypothetical protein